jgi:HTH-type transcriptional regulator, transcriptional repressor of NAD biosynthesis genes
MTNGIVIGRFMPLHAGHIAMIRTARALVDHLTIILCWQQGDSVPGAKRLQWLLEMFPSVRVVGIDCGPPIEGAGAPQLLKRLRDEIQDLHRAPIDQLISSDRRQGALAEALGTRFTLMDPDHQAVPVTSSEVRADPLAHWRFVPPAVRPAYAHTICLHGPESTGKTTLAPLLARHFDTLYVPEYGRTYCEQYGLKLEMDDLVAIGRTHAAMTQALLRQCNRRLILDTDPLMSAVWADMLFETRDPWFDAFQDTADLYLLLDIDMPWIDDGTRFFGDEARRQRFFDLSRAELERRGLAYRIIGGPPEQRFAQAVEAIEEAGL